MEEKKNIYYWKCSECGTEQEVVSSYFEVDGEANEKCCRCGKRVHCSLNLHKKKDGGVLAFTKE